MENPFFHRGPIREREFFFDRSDELNRAVSLLRNRQSVSIVGPRRIGKTSFLFRLAHELRSAPVSPDLLPIAIYVDCSSLRLSSEMDLYATLLSELKEQLGDNQLSQLIDLPGSESAISFRTFEQVIRELTRQQHRLVFFLDEFATLSENPYLTVDAFLSLRALAMRYGVIYVTASTVPLLELTYAQSSRLSSPFFNFFAQIRLGLFNAYESQHLLQTLTQQVGIIFDTEDMAKLMQLSGPHPLMLQIAGYHAIEQMRRAAMPLKECMDVIRDRFLDDITPHWTYFWNNLNANDQRLLALLPVGWRSDSEGVQRLEQAGLVIRSREGVIPVSPEFQSFVARQTVPGLHQAIPITVDPNQHLALLRGRPLSLSPTEFTLLDYLVERAGQITPHDILETHVWGDTHGDPERLKTTLRSLRHGLGRDSVCIENERGIGYRFVRATY